MTFLSQATRFPQAKTCMEKAVGIGPTSTRFMIMWQPIFCTHLPSLPTNNRFCSVRWRDLDEDEGGKLHPPLCFCFYDEGGSAVLPTLRGWGVGGRFWVVYFVPSQHHPLSHKDVIITLGTCTCMLTRRVFFAFVPSPPTNNVCQLITSRHTKQNHLNPTILFTMVLACNQTGTTHRE